MFFGDWALKIAYLINQYPKVSHTFIRREIQALERLGLTVHRFALRGWDVPVADAQDEDERARTSYVLRRGLVGLFAPVLAALLLHPVGLLAALSLAWRLSLRADRGLSWHLIYLAEACWLLPRVERAGVQHLHAHFGTNPAAVAALLRALGGPTFSFTVHGPEEFDKPQALHLAAKVEWAEFVVAISSFGRSQLLRWLPHEAWAKVQVVHCGVDEAFLAVQPTPVPCRLRFVCVGRLCEQKGQLLLIDALHQLRQVTGLPVELVLAGDGDMRGAIEARIQALQLDTAVRITGWIGSAEVKTELDGARALVLPSFAEGLPVVLMEAMALGRPVISTLVAGIPELVRDGQEGWLVPAGDVEALVGAMRDCAELKQEALQSVGDAARTRVQERHNIRREAERLRQLLLSGGAAR